MGGGRRGEEKKGGEHRKMYSTIKTLFNNKKDRIKRVDYSLGLMQVLSFATPCILREINGLLITFYNRDFGRIKYGSSVLFLHNLFRTSKPELHTACFFLYMPWMPTIL